MHAPMHNLGSRCPVIIHGSNSPSAYKILLPQGTAAADLCSHQALHQACSLFLAYCLLPTLQRCPSTHLVARATASACRPVPSTLQHRPRQGPETGAAAAPARPAGPPAGTGPSARSASAAAATAGAGCPAQRLRGPHVHCHATLSGATADDLRGSGPGWAGAAWQAMHALHDSAHSAEDTKNSAAKRCSDRSV